MRKDSAPALPPIAPFRPRISAFIFDVVVFYGGVFLFLAIVGLSGFDPYFSDVAGMTEEEANQRADAVTGAIAAVAAVVYFAWVPTRFDGQTPGKRLNGIRIITVDGSVPTFSRLVLRNTIGYVLSYWIFFIGFLIAFRDDEKRTLHDRMAKTRVVIADRKDKP
ncbi:MAG: RDD family protein [Chloroflexota bacterium]